MLLPYWYDLIINVGLHVASSNMYGIFCMAQHPYSLQNTNAKNYADYESTNYHIHIFAIPKYELQYPFKTMKKNKT